ncbi:hypothetical protein JTB14_004192 [Gonioctena quinquepunctata]|nr:hypothetical protein JTB14_004192 [Gonioctena quinquepunctata]
MRKLLESIKDKRSTNVIAIFEKCGVIPLNADKVLNMLPVETETTDTENDINASFINILKSMRYDENQPKPHKKKLQVPAGKSVAIDDFESPDESDQNFSTHDSNSDMDPMSDLEEAFNRRYDAAEEVIFLPTFNGSRISNNSPQVSVSNSVLTVTKDDVNIGDWLLVHLPYFMNDKAQCTSKTFSRHYIAQVVKLIEDGYEKKLLETIQVMSTLFRM